MEIVKAAALLAAGIAALGGLGAGLGQGIICAHAIDAIARQPEAKSDVMSTMFIGVAMTETTAIFSVLISLILIFIKG